MTCTPSSIADEQSRVAPAKSRDEARVLGPGPEQELAHGPGPVLVLAHLQPMPALVARAA